MNEIVLNNKPVVRLGAGRIVEATKGTIYKKGVLFNKDPLVNGKYQVYFTDGTKGLIKLENLKVVGYFD